MNIKETKEIKASAESAALFASTILNAATSVHYLHFKTRSFSQHETLGALYEALPGFADSLVEVWQGKYQTLLEFPSQGVTSPNDALDFVVKLQGFVVNNRFSFASQEDTELQNIIDELLACIEKAIYKLKFLA